MNYIHKINSFFKAIFVKYKIKRSKKIRIIVGASNTFFKDWISTEKSFFDISDKDSWENFFKPESIDNILAEHVLEHLYEDDIKKTLKYAYNYLKTGGIFRIAVPDALHPSIYLEKLTEPGGPAPGADDHKVFLSVYKLEELAFKAGFKVKRLEYFDKGGVFHNEDFNYEAGYISRCAKNYKGRFTEDKKEFDKMINSVPTHLRNQFYDKNISYVSLLVDLIK